MDRQSGNEFDAPPVIIGRICEHIGALLIEAYNLAASLELGSASSPDDEGRVVRVVDADASTVDEQAEEMERFI